MKNFYIFLKNNSFRFYAISYDIFFIICAWYLSYLLRFNFQIPSQHQYILNSSLIIVFFQIVIFYLFEVYYSLWRFISINDLKKIIVSTTLSIILAISFMYFYFPNYQIPRSIFIIYIFISIIFICGGRFIIRIFFERQINISKKLNPKRVVIIGSSKYDINFATELHKSSDWDVIGLIDNDSSLHQNEIYGLKILGGISNLDDIYEKYFFHDLIVVSAKLDFVSKRKILDFTTNKNINCFTLPPLDQMLNSNHINKNLRPIEIEDLLGRDPVDLDSSGLKRFFKNKTIFVSGAGGSIGSELVNQIIKYEPNQIICFDLSEYSLYKLQEVLSSKKYNVNISFIMGDVKNKERLNSIFSMYNPSIIFHAAAYKHVPLLESINITEAFNNNVIGTENLCSISVKHNVKKFILISTDKAVNPTNIMGASKRLSEMVCQGYQEKFKTKFVVVRFGNVLGSSGSVIPKFKDQISKGGPITVTHESVTRFFMSIPEASKLVLQSAIMGNGGEIFVLDMGKPIKIIDLAQDMIRLSGLSKDDIKINITGLRPGEKLYEELLSNDENTLLTNHPKLRIASATKVSYSWVMSLLKWIDKISSMDEKKIKKDLVNWVPEYDNKNH